MGSIGSALSGYYQLSNLLSSGSGSSGSTSSSATSEMNSLAQMLESADAGSSLSGSSSYMLDLSPEAQQLMNSSGTSSSSSGSSSSFILSSAQQATIEKIIEKYKNSPFNQTTFDEMQSDLQAAGLSPETLGAKDQVSSFNPTGVLLDSLNGNYASIQTPGTTESDEQTKESKYMQSIISLWKSDSAASSASGSASSTVANVTASA